MTLCKFAFPRIRIPSVSPSFPTFALPILRVEIPEFGISFSLTIPIPSLSFLLSMPVLPLFGLSLPEFGLLFLILIMIPSVSLSLPNFALPWPAMPPCPLEEV